MNFPPLTMVIPSCNEGEWLTRTVRSIRENEPADIEIIHVDDASDRPEPDLSGFDARTIRLPRRMGAARARAIGMAQARESSTAIGTCDSHMLFGEGDALAALVEEVQRFQTIDGQVRNPSSWESRVMLYPAKLSTLARIAVERNALAYVGPCRQGAATIRWTPELLRVGWLARIETPSIIETAAPFGGVYLSSRDALETLRGYPQLPGYFGFEEEALALLCAANRIPICCWTEASPWHVYRGQGVDPIPRPYDSPQDRELDNLAAVYRLAFGQEMWDSKWRMLLASAILPSRDRAVPGYILRAVESEQFTAYRDAVQEDFQLRDEALIEEVNRRMAADLITRAAQEPRRV